MHKAVAAIESDSAFRGQLLFAAALLLLGACEAVRAKPPPAALEPGRHALSRLALAPALSAAATPAPFPAQVSAPAPIRAFASGDVLRRNDFVSRPVLNDAWRQAHENPRAYPATFSSVPDLHSRAYLQDLSIPTMGGNGRGIRDQSPTEQFIRQARKEGLPLARLWQNEQALLSLGLNRKGKPGLWIIQKTR